MPPQTTRYGIIVELWSAISVSLMLLLIVSLIWFHLVPWFGALAIGVVGYIFIEASFRRRLTVLMLRTSLFLAVVAACYPAVGVPAADRAHGDHRRGGRDLRRQHPGGHPPMTQEMGMPTMHRRTAQA